MNDPFTLLLLTAAALYVGSRWWKDLRASTVNAAEGGRFPGATPAPPRAIAFGVAGALVLVALETAGELRLGIAHQQTHLTAVSALYAVLAAPIVEELVFRGYFVVENHGRAARWLAAIAASGIFALLHPFLWSWQDGRLQAEFTPKAAFSTAALFVASLWFYVVRFAAWNPARSLLPCFAAHAAKNAGVVAVKAATGFVSGWW